MRLLSSKDPVLLALGWVKKLDPAATPASSGAPTTPAPSGTPSTPAPSGTPTTPAPSRMPSSPAPSISPASSTAPAPPATGSPMNAGTPAPSTAPGTPSSLSSLMMRAQLPASTATAQSGALVQESQGYTRRAAANLINRLKNNTSRLHELPADLQTLVSSEEKSKLISMLCEADGNLEVMMGNFRAMQAGCLSIRLQGCRDHSTFRFLAIGLTHFNCTA